jgi:hypothetical protein
MSMACLICLRVSRYDARKRQILSLTRLFKGRSADKANMQTNLVGECEAEHCDEEERRICEHDA